MTDNNDHRYDAAIVLGSKPDTDTWEFPKHVYATLDHAAALFAAGKIPKIIVSGNYALSFDSHGITQPYRECDKMADYLRVSDVPASAILTESESKDTISNIAYIKQKILIPDAMDKLLIISADFRIERIKFLAAKILGPAYSVDFIPVPDDEAGRRAYPNEAETMRRTKLFLKDMSDGDHAFLDDKFYNTDYYRQ